MSRLNSSAIVLGSGIALVIIIPAVVIARIASSGDDVSDSWRYAFVALILVATFVGSMIAGRREPEAPMLHGAVAGLVTFLVGQLVSWGLRGAFGNPFGLVFFSLAFMCLGAVAGFVGVWLRGGEAPSDAEGGAA